MDYNVYYTSMNKYIYIKYIELSILIIVSYIYRYLGDDQPSKPFQLHYPRNAQMILRI